jgi:branched-chain amino acid aminotransferase
MAGFEECFITGTAAEVTPVSEIGQYRFKPGQICETLMNDYTAEVNRPLAAEASRQRFNASV